jgi:ATP-dependent Clp protease ATP-binding subunit ClpX
MLAQSRNLVRFMRINTCAGHDLRWSLHSRHVRCIYTTAPLWTSQRTPDLNSGFTGSYDPTTESGRGPMFNKTNFGVPQFYPRDLKKRVDEYVVGQERAKRTICSTLFNHYQKLRRRHQHEHEQRNFREKLMRQRFTRDRETHQKRRDTHPVEGWQTLPLYSDCQT